MAITFEPNCFVFKLEDQHRDCCALIWWGGEGRNRTHSYFVYRKGEGHTTYLCYDLIVDTQLKRGADLRERGVERLTTSSFDVLHDVPRTTT